MLERNRDKAARATIEEISAQYDRIALVFQGGGALGAYQAGVYEALANAGCEPNWLSGVSIGAINASIIAGNEPRNRLQRLEQFWQTISGRKIWAYTPEGDLFRDIRNRTSSWITMSQGQPGFFKPRLPNPWLELPGAEGATSFYDTSDLKRTLEEVVDFDILNDGRKRLSVGAVNVRTGNFVYFDTDEVRIGPEHIMASGALPPAFPAIRIEGEYYWDGGIVSNTPLQYLLDQEEERSSLVFQVDLFSARGTLPRSMPDVLSRHKDIMYSSRTRQNTDNFRRIHGIKTHLIDALKRVPKDLLTRDEQALIDSHAKLGLVNIVHLIYQHKNYEGHAKDYEFSGTSMREHWDMGLEDTQRTLRHRQWLLPPVDAEGGMAIHDLHREDPT
ncbi:patatin-like phospholipase family protein [Labrys portucalensis]|uniref:Patatin-like phospholipase family protein n=1 Tax=Labrys neptuniae TaxID=376174 RepID=A0ABV6ZC90_9HYPH